MFYKATVFTILLVVSLNATTNIKKLSSFKADFLQKITSTQGKVIDYSGEVFIKSNGKILWNYKLPIKKSVYILKDFVIIDEPELEQAIFTKLENEINIIKLLSEARKINKNTYIAKLNDNDYLIELKENKIDSIKYKDKLDNNVTILFKNAKQNIDISDNIFKFTAPDYYDIIRK